MHFGETRDSGEQFHECTEGWNEDVFAFNDYHVTPEGNAALKPPGHGMPYLVTEAVGVVEALPRYFRWTSPPALLGLTHAEVCHGLQSVRSATWLGPRILTARLSRVTWQGPILVPPPSHHRSSVDRRAGFASTGR